MQVQDLINQTALLAVLIAVGFSAAAVLLYSQIRRIFRTKTAVDSTYERLVKQSIDPRKAAAKPPKRDTKSDTLYPRQLTMVDHDGFSELWRSVQARYVDIPRRAVMDADHVVRNLMTKRGCPMNAFDQQAGFTSFDRPELVETYRLAHAIAVKAGLGHATTGDLRQAMAYYRYLFEDLLSARSVERVERMEAMKR